MTLPIVPLGLRRGEYARGMKPLALLVALFIMVIAMVGIVSPDRLIAVGHYVITPVGLYAIAAFRIAMGLVLMLAAPASRAPRTLRVLGAVVIVAGFATPFFGVDRARGFADWAEAQGPLLIRSVAVVVLAIGSFIAFAVGAVRRSA